MTDAPATESAIPVWAVLPVKNTVDAKQRLAPALSAAHRQGLFRAMMQDVLTALAGARSLTGIAVVTRDDEAAAIARAHGAEVVSEPANDGHTSAVTRGGDWLRSTGRAAMLALPADVPLVTSEEVDILARSLTANPGFSIAPSGDEMGSNGVALCPPDLIDFAFGDDSFGPHLERARARGVEPEIFRLPGFALDVDRPDDLARFSANPSATHAYRYLRDNNLLGRL